MVAQLFRCYTVMIGVAVALSGCTALEQLRALVQPPTFEEAGDRPAEVRLTGPSVSAPLGGATIRIWTRVTNPNTFGITLGTLAGTLLLEGNRAATVDFPLGLPLGAGQENVVPIDLVVSFSDVPALASVIRRKASNQPLEYSLDGTIGVDAGRFGQPVFGPMTIVRGALRVR